MNWYKIAQRVRNKVYPGVEELPAGLSYTDIGHKINKDEKRVLWGLDGNWVFRTKELEPEEYRYHEKDVLGEGWIAGGRYVDDGKTRICTIAFCHARPNSNLPSFQEKVYRTVIKKFPAGTIFYKA